jgi:hypothetical protein
MELSLKTVLVIAMTGSLGVSVGVVVGVVSGGVILGVVGPVVEPDLLHPERTARNSSAQRAKAARACFEGITILQR